ncbi:hypothetical protein BgAZ_106910 [Babesia gibsoni]|uniref:Leucine-rich repeat protein n=1 Tax=Babesia gibsoni TaxID=33632 RepID=A0AAD8PGJ0_BABGI|nr:hypothetical protein BgAZ_106910 [Babesia gibsoni]
MLFNLSGERLATLQDDLVAGELCKLGLAFEDVTELDVSSCKLTSLDGIERFVNLNRLDACFNEIVSVVPLWKLGRLKVVKLRHNRLGPIWLRKVGAATVITTNYDLETPLVGLEPVHYSLLDLEANNIDSIRADPLAALDVDCLLIPNNGLVDITGIAGFNGVNTIDFTNNAIIDAAALLFMGYKLGLRVFLQGCEIINQECLLQLLDRDPEAEIIAPGDVKCEHHRLVKATILDLNRLCEKQFVDFDCEFADFRYAGDLLPCELKTPRNVMGENLEATHYVVRASNLNTKRIETISTMVDLPHAAVHSHRSYDSLKVYSTIGSVSEDATPLSINTMDGEYMAGNLTPSPKVLPYDGGKLPYDGGKDVDMVKNSYMDEICVKKNKLPAAEWVETIKDEFYSQFRCAPDTTINP